MTSIPLLVETIEFKQFRCIYLKNKTFFLIFFCIFWICIKFRTFWKKDDPPSFCFSETTVPKDRLDKCLKARVWEAGSTDDMGNGRNTGSILMRAPLSHWLMTVKVIELENSLSETWNVWTLFVNTLTADYKYSLISKDNSMQTIEKHLSQKTKHFLSIFFCIFGICIKFRTFSKKDDPHSLCISEVTDHEGRA